MFFCDLPRQLLHTNTLEDIQCTNRSSELTVQLNYSKTCVKRPLPKSPQIGFQDHLWLNAGQKYCRMLQGEHSAILSTFIKLPFVIKIFVLSISEQPFYTGFTVYLYKLNELACHSWPCQKHVQLTLVHSKSTFFTSSYQ